MPYAYTLVLRFLTLMFSAVLMAGCSGGSSGGGGGSNEPVAQAAVVTMTPQATKQFVFAWENFPAEAEYRLLENPDGLSGYTEVAVIPAEAESYSHEVFLPDRVNASYILQACNSAGTCADSSEMFVTGNLADAVGYFKASNRRAGDQFGYSVSLSGDGQLLAVGARFEDGEATGVNGDQDKKSGFRSGAVYVFSKSENGWVQQAYVKASNTDNGDNFGWSVSLSFDGDTLAVGAPNERSAATGVDGDQTDNSTSSVGAVYIFSRANEGWSQQAYLKASDANISDRFGSAVALSADGNRLAVGAPDADQVVSRSGAVYVFDRINGSWLEEALLKASSPDAFDFFGRSISLSSDGDILAIGASFEDGAATGVNGDQTDDSAGYSGAAYVFAFNETGGGWTQQAYLKASNTDPNDRFGSSVSLSGNGDLLAVGAPSEGSASSNVDGQQLDNSAAGAGAVYMFARTEVVWAQQAYLKASNTDAGDGFGSHVSLSEDGLVLSVLAPQESSAVLGLNGDPSGNSENPSGAVYLFNALNGAWSQQAYIKPPVPLDASESHVSAVLSGDGRALAVGYTAEAGGSTGINGDRTDQSGFDSGAVFIY